MAALAERVPSRTGSAAGVRATHDGAASSRKQHHRLVTQNEPSWRVGLGLSGGNVPYDAILADPEVWATAEALTGGSAMGEPAPTGTVRGRSLSGRRSSKRYVPPLQRGRASGTPGTVWQHEKAVVVDPSAKLRRGPTVMPPWTAQDRALYFNSGSGVSNGGLGTPAGHDRARNRSGPVRALPVANIARTGAVYGSDGVAVEGVARFAPGVGAWVEEDVLADDRHSPGPSQHSQHQQPLDSSGRSFAPQGSPVELGVSRRPVGLGGGGTRRMPQSAPTAGPATAAGMARGPSWWLRGETAQSPGRWGDGGAGGGHGGAGAGAGGGWADGAGSVLGREGERELGWPSRRGARGRRDFGSHLEGASGLLTSHPAAYHVDGVAAATLSQIGTRGGRRHFHVYEVPGNEGAGGDGGDGFTSEGLGGGFGGFEPPGAAATPDRSLEAEANTHQDQPQRRDYEGDSTAGREGEGGAEETAGWTGDSGDSHPGEDGFGSRDQFGETADAGWGAGERDQMDCTPPRAGWGASDWHGHVGCSGTAEAGDYGAAGGRFGGDRGVPTAFQDEQEAARSAGRGRPRGAAVAEDTAAVRRSRGLAGSLLGAAAHVAPPPPTHQAYAAMAEPSQPLLWPCNALGTGRERRHFLPPQATGHAPRALPVWAAGEPVGAAGADAGAAAGPEGGTSSWVGSGRGSLPADEVSLRAAVAGPGAVGDVDLKQSVLDAYRAAAAESRQQREAWAADAAAADALRRTLAAQRRTEQAASARAQAERRQRAERERLAQGRTSAETTPSAMPPRVSAEEFRRRLDAAARAKAATAAAAAARERAEEADTLRQSMRLAAEEARAAELQAAERQKELLWGLDAGTMARSGRAAAQRQAIEQEGRAMARRTEAMRLAEQAAVRYARAKRASLASELQSQSAADRRRRASAAVAALRAAPA